MSFDSQIYESYVPVYDAIPEKWDEARPFLVETLKKISEGVNTREIGFFLDEELLSGKQFIPTLEMSGINSGDSQQFRTIFRKVINCSPLVAGANSFAHGITFDSNFTLIDLWVSATNSSTLTATTMSDPSNVNMNSTDILITSPGAYDRAFAVIEYLLEK
jgi:hypothetical protein